MEISDGTGVVLENLTVIGSSAGDKVTSAVSVANVVDLRLSHVNVVHFATGEATGVALGDVGLPGRLRGRGTVFSRPSGE